MVENTSTLCDDLSRRFAQKQRLYYDGLSIARLPSMAPRHDGPTIFDEGAEFSGISQAAPFEACITPVASPHVQPSIGKVTFLDVASSVFQKPVRLSPDLKDHALMPPQLVLWWRRKEKGVPQTTEILDLHRLPADEQRSIFQLITTLISPAARIVNHLGKDVTLWGTWGHATPEERLRTGLGRGGPTNKEGHLHIIYFDAENQPVTNILNSTTEQQLNHFALWNSSLLDHFGLDISQALGDCWKTIMVGQPMKTEVIKEYTQHANGSLAVQEGYKISLSDPVTTEVALKGVAQFAGICESLYKTLQQFHSEYYINIDNPKYQAEVVNNIHNCLESSGFPPLAQQAMAKYILSIKPTYGQILEWEKQTQGLFHPRLDQLVRKYHRHHNQVVHTSRPSSIKYALVKDTYLNPSELATSCHVWPVHSSWAYIIPHINVQANQVLVNEIRLFPIIGSTESGPERMLGSVLSRDLPTTTPLAA